ncbi:MAG: hypothetical protein U0X74_08595 [Anaerolineales bacterium]
MLPQNPHELHPGVICNITTSTGESYSKEMSYVEYKHTTEHMLELIEKDKEEAYYLLVPFIFTLCASLEAILNDFLIINSLVTHGPAEYKSIAEGYIGVSFAKKLRITVAVLSDNAFQLREDSQNVKELNRLISVRNKLTHAQSFFTKDQISQEGKSEISPSFNSTSYRPTVKDCRAFYNAFTEFDEKFIQQYDNGLIVENDLVRASEILKQRMKDEESEKHSE